MKLSALLPAILVAGFTATAVAGDMPTIDATKYGYKEFRMGILGGENAQDRQKTYECFTPLVSKLLGVPAKIFVAKDYAGTMEGLLGKTVIHGGIIGHANGGNGPAVAG